MHQVILKADLIRQMVRRKSDDFRRVGEEIDGD